jgi:hypothetical protein
MKTNVNYVDAAEFEAIILRSDIPHKLQKGFVKLVGPQGRNIYVAATKRVGRVDLSGFEMLDAEGKLIPGFVKPHCGEFGNVKQQLDFSLPQEDILQNFELVILHMKGLQPAERKPRPIGQTKPSDPKGWTTISKKDRKELIEKVAKEKGVKVSKKTKTELGIEEIEVKTAEA